MIARARSARRALIEMVYPRRCAECGRRGTWVCAECAAAVSLLAPPWCQRCGAPVVPGDCRCRVLPPAIDCLRSAAPYEGWVRRAIIAVKFEDERDRAESLGPLLNRLLPELEPIAALIPVPLHPSRQRERGFNQSELLVRLAAGNRTPVRSDLLVRTRPTRHQVGLGADDRRANVHGAFAVPPGIELTGQRLVLIDDVLTTGATLGNCAEALKAAGALFVAAVTVARE